MTTPLISNRYKFVLFWNGKCACTSLKQWFCKIHDLPSTTWREVSGIETKTIELDETKYTDYKKYIVIRDPAERLASSFICDIAYGIVRTNNKNPTFQEYVDYFYENMELVDMNEHTCLQSNLKWKNVVFDRIIHIDNINVAFTDICKELDIPLCLPSKTHSLTVKNHSYNYPLHTMRMNQFMITRNSTDLYVQNKAVKIPGYSGFFTKDIIEKIYEIYKNDYTFFNILFNTNGYV
jgi:hypothetical protein